MKFLVINKDPSNLKPFEDSSIAKIQHGNGWTPPGIDSNTKCNQVFMTNFIANIAKHFPIQLVDYIKANNLMKLSYWFLLFQDNVC